MTDRAGVRRWRRIAAIGLLLALCLPAHLACTALGRRSRWPQRFLRWAGRAAGINVRIVGTPLVRDALLVANHVGWLDILILAGASGARFVAMEELAQSPALGYLASLNRTIYVARTRRGEVRAQADGIRAALAEGTSVALFPEGGTGDGITVGPFRAPLFAALSPPLSGVRIQPVAIDYRAAAGEIAWTGDIAMGEEAMRVLALPGRRRATLHFLAPIDPAQWPDRKALAVEARRRIVAALEDQAAAP